MPAASQSSLFTSVQAIQMACLQFHKTLRTRMEWCRLATLEEKVEKVVTTSIHTLCSSRTRRQMRGLTLESYSAVFRNDEGGKRVMGKLGTMRVFMPGLALCIFLANVTAQVKSSEPKYFVNKE